MSAWLRRPDAESLAPSRTPRIVAVPTQFRLAWGCALVVTAAATLSPLTSAAASRDVAFFPSAWGVFGRQGIVRVINRSDEAGEVTIAAFDDDGNAYGPVHLALRANQAAHFNSRDLEYGNPGKGLSGATGPGRGDWRLELESDLDIDVLAYLRTRDGLITAIHDTARWSDGGLFVPVFGPGSSRNRESLLRLVNIGDAPAAVTIAGTDDAGTPGAGPVSLEIPAGASRTYSAAALETGSAPGLGGALGDGAGRWRLTVRSEQPLAAVSLLASRSGHLTNLSGDGTDRSTSAFDFRRGPLGFVADFADYPPAHEEIYRLDAGHRPLPEPLEPESALFIGGDNRSDDLFMFYRAQVGGLLPGARYFVAFEAEIATDVPTGCFGIGGSPGESVWVKAGAAGVEPVPALVGTHLRMNVDIGRQSNEGENAVVLGTVANTRTCEEPPGWELKLFPVRSLNAPVVASPGGRIWLLFGVDSGFEGRTEIYFTRARVTFTPARAGLGRP